MATWKEKGEVPDSDDDDISDSQSVTSNTEPEPEPESQLQPRPALSIGLEGSEDTAIVDAAEEPLLPPICDLTAEEKSNELGVDVQANLERSPSIVEEIVSLVEASQTLPHIPDIDGLVYSPATPQSSFKIPDEIEEHVGDRDQEIPTQNDFATISPEAEEEEFPSIEEISKSYIHLSPKPARDFPALVEPPAASISNHLFLDPHFEKSQELVNDTGPSQSEIEHILIQDQLEHRRRNLRERKAIQVHPYLVEQQKYRQSLKARGITPMRIENTPVESTRRRAEQVPQSSGIQEEHFQSSATQDDVGLEQFDSSQLRQSDWESTPSSIPNKPVNDNDDQATNGNREISDDEDGGLPSIAELAQRKNMASKTRLKTYSTKRTKQGLPNVQTQSLLGHTSRNRKYDPFDLPDSPPVTSSPRPRSTSKIFRRSNSLAMTNSSKEPSPSLLDQDELDFQHVAEMPTPAMSVSKPASENEILQIDSSSEDDPFTVLPTEEPDQSLSSSDESFEIRKIGRRLGGVLPASHLRLFQQQQHSTPKPRHKSKGQSASNVKSPAQKGPVASRRLRDDSNGVIPIFSDDESSTDSDIAVPHVERPSIYRNTGSAEEDDRIDAMLPSRNRQPKLSASGSRKRKRTASTSMFGKRRDGLHQMKMTDSVDKARTTKRRQEGNRPLKRKRHGSKHTPTSEQGAVRANVPKLGILDVIDLNDPIATSTPNFIKIAARTAKKRKDQGRQSPGKKFIRLANREDTQATQNTLNEWKRGGIRPKQLARQRKVPDPLTSLRLRENGQQSYSPTPAAYSPLQARENLQRRERRPLLVISRANRTKQVSIDGFLTADKQHSQQPIENRITSQTRHSVRRRSGIPRHEAPLARPAQLESSVLDYQYQHPVAAFKTTKRALDALYRSRKRRPAGRSNDQLNRFLADEDDNTSMVDSPSQVNALVNPNPEPNQVLPQNRLHPRKRKPIRLDAGAAIYRQPSEPLILDYLVTNQPETFNQDGKLVGLAKLGTNYPRHFDILPMQSGVFFHETTFVGSGRLSAAVEFLGTALLHSPRSNFTFQLADKEFRWGTWDEKVSSEVGICFDWLTEYLGATASTDTVSRSVDVTHIMTCIIDYTQHHLNFINHQDEERFLIRMLEIFHDIYARIQSPGNESQNCVQATTQFLARSVVLILQVLKLSRTQDTRFTLSCQLEDQLKKFGRLTAYYLTTSGLDTLRSIYDDLQYLSVRERGIRDNHHVIQAWIMIWKAFDSAKIIKGSFWDIVYTQLPGVELDSLNDARIMENIWYSIFTLLPLSEFDDAGVVNPFTRFKVSWDNWVLPQQLLKRVFNLYASNARQPPGFNDYCKALLGRCHYLIHEWGWWKCSGLIGTIFDFFAAEKLAHLRNEEVYKSPRFLEELHLQPSLEIDPEDRCFHIFLKIVALVLKHMSQTEDFKGIRNLVARLLPNHDRQYPKEQAIHHRELASLRNHHDLLCTLYWAAPPDLRPSVALIQNLVVADESHKEACLTNLQAWLNISRFVLVSTPDSMLSEVYEPLATWQSTQFLKILKQYDEAETDIRKQVEQLPQQSKTGFTESQLQATIKTNRQTTMSTVRAFMDAVHNLFDSLPHPPSVTQITAPANLETFAALFNTRTSPFGAGWDTAMVGVGVEFVERYLVHLSKVDPEARRSEATSTSEEDSQDFGSIDIDAYDFEILGITPVRATILPAVRNAIRQALYSADQDALNPGTSQHMAMSKLTMVWAVLASLFIRKESFQPSDFLLGGQNTLFNDRHVISSSLERHVLIATAQWPLFLGILVKNTQSVFPDITQRSLTSNKIRTFNLGMEWMTALAKPVGKQYHEHVLTAALCDQDFFLLRGLPEWPVDIRSIVADADFNLLCLRTSIDNMNKLLSDQPRRAITHNNRSLQEVKEEFAHVLRKVMKVMEVELKQMADSSSPTHQKYVTFVQEVAKRIRSHAKDILPLPDFFVHSSIYFWPDQSDPTYQLASLRAYTIRLGKGETGAIWETFHYLYNAFKRALFERDLDSYLQKVRKAAKAWSFFRFMIDNMIPAAIQVGFNDNFPLHAISWTLCAATFPVIRQSQMSTGSFEYFIEGGKYGDDEAKAEHTYRSALHILKLIMKGLWKYMTSRGGQPIEPNTRGMISLVCQLGDYLVPAMLNYVSNFPDKADPVINSFCKFMSDARDYGEGPHSLYSIAADSTIQDIVDPDPFVKAIYSDMVQWAVAGFQQYAGDAIQHDVDFSELVVKIPDHGTLREIDLTTPIQNLSSFHEVLQCANILTIGEGRFTSKRVPVSRHVINTNGDITNILEERNQRFSYRDTSRSRILMKLSNF